MAEQASSRTGHSSESDDWPVVHISIQAGCLCYFFKWPLGERPLP